MSSVSLVLDKLRMTSLTDSLEVCVSSSVSLVCPDKDVRILESSQLLTLLRSGHLWVTRGNGCRLEFTILLNGLKGDQQSRETVIQNLSYYLRDTPLWSQISLDAKIHFPQSDGSDRSQPDFTIGLRHSFSSESPFLSGGLQLSAAADIKAPRIVPCLQFKAVEICMNFNSSKARLAKRSRASEYLRRSQSFHDSDDFLEEVFAPLDEHSSSDSLFLHASSVTDPREFFEDKEMLDEESFSVRRDDVFSLPASQSSNASSLVSQSFHECERECKDRTDQAIPVSLNITGAHKMAECAIRTLIGGRQTKSHPEFKVLKPHSGQALSQIAPALWSPGFLDAISQRSRFVPTISHVFSSTCLINAISPSLKRKLANLVSKEKMLPPFQPAKGGADQGINKDDPEGQAVPDTVEDVVQGRIWRMMQLSLYDPLAARRLRPPHNHNAQHTEGVTGEPEIPDNVHRLGITIGQPEMLEGDFFSFLEDEFDNLLDNTAEEDAGEGEEIDNDFEALFDDVQSEGFEDLLNSRVLDGSQSGLCGPCTMDREDEDMIERGIPAVESWNEAPDMNTTKILDEEMEIENEDMLL